MAKSKRQARSPAASEVPSHHADGNLSEPTAAPQLTDEEAEVLSNAPASDEEMDGNLTSEDDSDDDEAAMETIAISDIPKQTIVQARNDVPTIERKLTEIALFDEASPTPLPFSESLTVQLPLKSPLSSKLALDDLEREKRFAEITAAAVHDGLDLLRKQRVKFRRPSDFFAEMAKTDEHMGKVKSQILFNKERIEAAEKRKNNRDIKKNKKKVRQEQIEKEQDKKRKAREEIEAYSRLRQERLKQRAEGDEPSDDEFPIDMLEVEQLDDENKFQKQEDVASGKKKAWRPGKPNSPARRGGHGKGKPRIQAKGRTDQFDNTGKRNNPGGAVGPRKGGIQKKKGPKKRLGKSRRVSGKSKS